MTEHTAFIDLLIAEDIRYFFSPKANASRSEVTLGTSSLCLGTRTGAGDTATLVLSF